MGPGETSIMRTHIASDYRIARYGWLVFAPLVLIALAACSNPTPSASTNASNGAMRVAGDNAASGSAHSVDQVSDVLGQRLDGMLSNRPTGAGTNH